MTRVNPSSGLDKSNNRKQIAGKRDLLRELKQEINNPRTIRNKVKPSSSEIFKLLGEASIKLPIAAILGLGNLVKNYLLEYRELGVAASQVAQDAIEFTKSRISAIKTRFVKPEEEVQIKTDLHSSINEISTDVKVVSGNSNHVHDVGIVVKSSPNSNARNKVKKEIEPALCASILEKEDRELIRELIISLNELVSKSSSNKVEKVVVLLESLLMGVPFEDYIGVFNASYKNHLEQEELLVVAKNELVAIIGSCIHDYDLANELVERLSNFSPYESERTSPEAELAILKFPTRASLIAKSFMNFSGIQQFLGVNSIKELSSEELDLRESFLNELMDLNPDPKRVNLNAEYKSYLDFKKIKNSVKYGFDLGRIDEKFREGRNPYFKTFSARFKLANILASTSESHEVLDFTSSLVEMADYGVSGVARLIDKVYKNRDQSVFYGHYVEAKNVCNLFKGLNMRTDIKSFKMEASKDVRGCDVDAYLEIIDNENMSYFVEIKSSPDYAESSKVQRNKLLENLPEGGKLVYIIDTVTESFIDEIVNYNEVAKLRELASNERIEIWQKDGKDLTSKIRKTLNINKLSLDAA